MGNYFSTINQGILNTNLINSQLLSYESCTTITIFCTKHSDKNDILFNNFLKLIKNNVVLQNKNYNIVYIIITYFGKTYIIFYALYNLRNFNLLKKLSGTISFIDMEFDNQDINIKRFQNINIYKLKTIDNFNERYFNELLNINLQLLNIDYKIEKNKLYTQYVHNLHLFIIEVSNLLHLKLAIIKNKHNIEYIFKQDFLFLRSICGTNKNIKLLINNIENNLMNKVNECVMSKSICF
jgi:hypothetical protein